MEMLYAIIDIGSSSIRLAVYHLEKDSTDLLLKKKHAIGLAGFIDNDCMTQAGIDKTVEIVKDFKDFLANFPISSMDAITTAALRNCRNSRKAVSEIEERTGISLRVISGDEEATFDFIGGGSQPEGRERTPGRYRRGFDGNCFVRKSGNPFQNQCAYGGTLASHILCSWISPIGKGMLGNEAGSGKTI